jgi:hypothetical protein
LAELNAKIGMLSSKNKLPKIFFIIVIVFIQRTSNDFIACFNRVDA